MDVPSFTSSLHNGGDPVTPKKVAHDGDNDADDVSDLLVFPWTVGVPDNEEDAADQLGDLFDSKDWLVNTQSSIQRAMELMTTYPSIAKNYRYYFRPVRGRGLQLGDFVYDRTSRKPSDMLPPICHFLKQRGYKLETVKAVHSLDPNTISEQSETIFCGKIDAIGIGRSYFNLGHRYKKISVLHLACAYPDGEQKEVIDFLLEQYPEAKKERLGFQQDDAAPFDTFMYHTVRTLESKSTLSEIQSKKLKDVYEKLWAPEVTWNKESLKLSIYSNCKTGIEFLLQKMPVDYWKDGISFEVTPKFDTTTFFGLKSMMSKLKGIRFYFNFCEFSKDPHCNSHRALFKFLSDPTIKFPRNLEVSMDVAVENELSLAKALEDDFPDATTICSLDLRGNVTPRVVQSVSKVCSRNSRVEKIELLIRREYNVELGDNFLLSFLRHAPKKVSLCFFRNIISSSTTKSTHDLLVEPSQGGRLEDLCIHGCIFRGDSFCRFVRGLAATVQNLRSLQLVSPDVECTTDEATNAIIILLKHDNLRELRLDSVAVDVTRICNELESKQNSFYLDLSCRDVLQEKTIESMTKALKNNLNLRISVYGNGIDSQCPSKKELYKYYQRRNRYAYELTSEKSHDRQAVIDMIVETKENKSSIGGKAKAVSLVYEVLRMTPSHWCHGSGVTKRQRFEWAHTIVRFFEKRRLHFKKLFT